jgi:N6-L-threonylcarbamoyladenine synthase
VGVVAAKALGLALGRPLLRVHHLEAHLYSIFLGDGAPEPAAAAGAVALLVSGGHTCLVRLEAPGRYRMLGRTLDDAAGEALDKGANLLRLGYPGGPAIERAAAGGRDDFVRFPRGAVAAAVDGLRPEFCFSFSGLKTALLHYLRERPSAFEDGTRRDVAASYEEAVVDALAQRVERALDAFRPPLVACAGGVARNRRLRERLAALAAAHGVPLRLAAPEYCTDNAAMVAAAAGAGLGRAVAEPADLDVEPSSPLA